MKLLDKVLLEYAETRSVIDGEKMKKIIEQVKKQEQILIQQKGKQK